jgi:hypothetical protein
MRRAHEFHHAVGIVEDLFNCDGLKGFYEHSHADDAHAPARGEWAHRVDDRRANQQFDCTRQPDLQLASCTCYKHRPSCLVLEVQLQSELNDPGRNARSLDMPESARTAICNRVAELCVIECVKELSSELQIPALVQPKRCSLDDGEIEVQLARARHNPGAGISETSALRAREQHSARTRRTRGLRISDDWRTDDTCRVEVSGQIALN